MKRAHKKRGKGRPKKANKMKAIVKAFSLYEPHEKKLKAIAKRLKLSESEVVRMLIDECDR
jgi:DNA-binding transcriptional regulator LsrR (DeoR family)